MADDCPSDGGECLSPSVSTTTTHPQHPILPLVVLSIREYLLNSLTETPFVHYSVTKINILATYVGVPQKSLLTNEEFVLSSTAMLVTLFGYYVLFGKRHRRKRKRLAEELRVAQRQVCYYSTQSIAPFAYNSSLWHIYDI